MITVTVQIDDTFAFQVAAAHIEQAVQATLQQCSGGSPAATLTVTITDNDTAQQLNRQYRGVDRPTDVLSFEYQADPDFPNVAPEMEAYLGDVIIAFPVAAAQAQAANHTPTEEVTLLAVHGTLHLLGFDHDTAATKAEMWLTQQQVMAGLGLAHVHPTEQ